MSDLSAANRFRTNCAGRFAVQGATAVTVRDQKDAGAGIPVHAANRYGLEAKFLAAFPVAH